MRAAELAAESAVHGYPMASASSNGYSSEAQDRGLSNGTSVGVVSPMELMDGVLENGGRVRSAHELKLIARGRFLLHTYQQRKRERQEIMDEMCFSSESELSAVDVLCDTPNLSIGGNGKNGYHHANGQANGHDAAAASMDSDENWLAQSAKTKMPMMALRWDDIEQLQSTNGKLLDSMELQLEQLWDTLHDGSVDDTLVEPFRQSVTRLLRQKRKTEASFVSVTRSISDSMMKNDAPSSQAGGVDTAGQDSGEQVQAIVKRETQDLQSELDEAKALIADLNARVNAYRTQLLAFSSSAPKSTMNGLTSTNGFGSSSTHDDDEIRRLENRIQEKEELLLSLRTSLEHVVQDHGKLDKELRKAEVTIERLQVEKSQMEKAAADKRTLLHRAYMVKAKQLDELCKDIELPASWERVADENGIVYYRQNDRACAPELEDPRVAIVLQRFSPTPTGSASPRSAAGRMEQSPHGTRGGDRKHSSSSFDSTVSCEDITIPPDDGKKHEVEDFETPLPEGWEMRVTTAGSVFFVNRNTNVTTWKDPRKMKRSGSTLSKRASAPLNTFETARLRYGAPERRASIGTLVPSSPTAENGGTRTFDVVFEEKGPIGIHFQANTPDAGATVRRLLPRMAAARCEQLEPYDRLVAVNKNPVDSAPFRYVMLLLQGGLRPLTLTFERDAVRRKSRQPSSEVQEAERLDEELVIDDTDPHATTQHTSGDDARRGTDSAEPTEDSSRPRRTSSTYSSVSEASSSNLREEEYSIADKIITNVFSLFWTPPPPPRSQVETV